MTENARLLWMCEGEADDYERTQLARVEVLQVEDVGSKTGKELD